MTKEKKHRIRCMARSVNSIDDLATIFAVSKSTIRRVLKEEPSDS